MRENTDQKNSVFGHFHTVFPMLNATERIKIWSNLLVIEATRTFDLS